MAHGGLPTAVPDRSRPVPDAGCRPRPCLPEDRPTPERARPLQPHRPAAVPGRPGPGRGAARARGAATEPAAARGGQAAPDRDRRLTRTDPPPTRRTEVAMPETPTTTSPTRGTEAERVR